MSFLYKNVVERIKQGDIQAYEKIFRELYSPLCGYANKIIGDHNRAEEMVQDVFFNIWKNRERLTVKISLKSYLYKSVKNACLQIAQHQLVKDKYKQFVSTAERDIQPNPQTDLELKEINMAIDKTLDTLPQRCKEIFYLNRFDGLKYKEIAEKLSISQKTVEANISKALKHLRKNLKQYVDAL